MLVNNNVYTKKQLYWLTTGRKTCKYVYLFKHQEMLHVSYFVTWIKTTYQSIIVCFMHLIKILTAPVLANHSPRTYIKSSWLIWIGNGKTLHLLIILMDDAIEHTCIWPLAWCNKYKLYNSSTPLQWFLTFSFTNQREREAVKDERTSGIARPGPTRACALPLIF